MVEPVIARKIIAFFFLPLPFCSLFLLLGLALLWFTKRQLLGKILVSAATLLLLLLSYYPLSDTLTAGLERQYQSPEPALLKGMAHGEPIRWVVVLAEGQNGCGLFPFSSRLLPGSLYGLVEGIRLYRSTPGARLLLSGGVKAGDATEAEAMSRVAQSLGVPSTDIVLETDSVDTESQARNIRPIVSEDPFILVASAVHMPRTMALFKKNAMHPIPFSGYYLSTIGCGSKLGIHYFFPSVDRLNHSSKALYELMGLIWAEFTRKI